MRPIRLDLHYVRHADVEDTLSNYFFFKGNNPIGAEIITGDSEQMRELVIKWLNHWEFTYDIPQHNNGVIYITG